ncbi:hypothetical protein ES703_99712 [subsurface metagenome]
MTIAVIIENIRNSESPILLDQKYFTKYPIKGSNAKVIIPASEVYLKLNNIIK